jgi:hypothetical protein
MSSRIFWRKSGGGSPIFHKKETTNNQHAGAVGGKAISRVTATKGRGAQ